MKKVQAVFFAKRELRNGDWIVNLYRRGLVDTAAGTVDWTHEVFVRTLVIGLTESSATFLAGEFASVLSLVTNYYNAPESDNTSFLDHLKLADSTMTPEDNDRAAAAVRGLMSY